MLDRKIRVLLLCIVSVFKWLRRPGSRHTLSLLKHIWQRRTKPNLQDLRLSLLKTLRLSINKEQCISHKRKSACYRQEGIAVRRATGCNRQPPFTCRSPTRSNPAHSSFCSCFLAPADAVCRSSDLSSSSSSHDGGDEHHSSNSSSSTLVYSSRNVRTVNFQRSQIPVTEFYVLLTVQHLGITLVNDQLDAQFVLRIYLFQISTCFEHSCAHQQGN